MPKPKPNESEQEFMSRCIPMVEGEGKPHDQAVAQCISLWENRRKYMKNIIHKIYKGEVKSFNDEELTIEHFISTEQEDRSKDTVIADGIKFDAVPVVLKQHGFDPDTGNEPIAKPLSIAIATNDNGVKGIKVRTKYYDGGHLSPPDNTGRRLYEKAKDGYMPYWSIGFRIIDGQPKKTGGLLIKECVVFEYSQVGVPDNVGAAVVKSMDHDQLLKKANELLVFEFKEDTKANPDDGGTNDKKKKNIPAGIYQDHTNGNDNFYYAVDSNDNKINFVYRSGVALTKDSATDEHIEIIKEHFKKPDTKLKSIADRVAQDIPFNAMFSLWWAMLDELYICDGKEKTIKIILKEFTELVLPYMIDFASTIPEDNPEMGVIKNLIDKNINGKVYVKDNGEGAEPAPPSQDDIPVPPDNTLIKALLGLKKEVEKKPENTAFKFSRKELTDIVTTTVREGIKEKFDEMRGKV